MPKSKSSALKPGVGGRLASARSKTGNPECSAAMSAWVRGRKTGAVSSAVFAMLGKCRAMARMMRTGQVHAAAGNEAKAQVLAARAKRGLTATQRKAKAKELAAARKGKAPAKAAAVPKPAPAPTRAGGFALAQESAKGKKTLKTYNDGAGKTGRLFDMKKGDLPGQTSIMDRVATPHTHEGTKASTLKQSTANLLIRSKMAKQFPNRREIVMADAAARAAKRPTATPSASAKLSGGNTGHFETDFHAHFDRIDQRNRGSNSVTLHDLRQSMPHLDKDQFNAELRKLRIKGGVHLDSHEGLYGKLAPAERAAAIHEAGSQYIYVSRSGDRHTTAPAAPSVTPPKSKRKPADERIGRQTARMSGVGQIAAADRGVQHGRDLLAQRSRTAAKLKAAAASAREQAHPEVHGKAGKTYDLGVDKIHFDPDRFQYKLAAQGSHGTTDALKDVKHFNPALAGTISVWKDPANGKTYVINGHHRLDLAKRTGAKEIKATYIDAPNHVEARAHGAMVNIAEGRGTSVDAAKFFRDRKIGPTEAAAEGVSLREHTAHQGLAMAGLSDHAFKRVVSGELKPARAAIIGGSGLSHDAQHQLLKELDKPRNKNLTDGTVQNMVHGAHAAGSRTVQTHDLFGSNEEEQSLFVHRAKAEDSIKRGLSEDKRLFGLVSKSKAAASLAERGQSHIDTETTGKIGHEAASVLHVFDELKHRDPHISRPLNEAAERIANGEHPKTVHAEARAKVTKRIKAILEGDVNPFD